MKKRTKYLTYLFLTLYAIISIFPLIWLLGFSLKTNREVMMNSAFALPETFLYENYVEAWVRGNVEGYFFNSVFVGIVSLIFTLIFGSMIAYAITRMRFKGQQALLFLFLAGMMVPIHASLIPIFIILKNLGLLKSYLAVILPYVGFGLPLAIFIFSNFLRSVPYELEQAAFIDGCGVIRAFVSIIVPTIKPAFATVGIFTFISNWNEFIMAATFLRDAAKKTLPQGLMAFQGEYSAQWGPMGAAIVISSLPLILVYIFFSEQIEKSFAAGAVLK